MVSSNISTMSGLSLGSEELALVLCLQIDVWLTKRELGTYRYTGWNARMVRKFYTRTCHATLTDLSVRRHQEILPSGARILHQVQRKKILQLGQGSKALSTNLLGPRNLWNGTTESRTE
jgi:hypothetical protein